MFNNACAVLANYLYSFHGERSVQYKRVDSNIIQRMDLRKQKSFEVVTPKNPDHLRQRFFMSTVPIDYDNILIFGGRNRNIVNS